MAGALALAVAGVAGCSGSDAGDGPDAALSDLAEAQALDEGNVYGVDLVVTDANCLMNSRLPPAGTAVDGGPCLCGEIAVQPTCCPACHAEGDGGCAPGEVANDSCGNCDGGSCPGRFCEVPCTPDPPFCVVAPDGCDSLTPLLVQALCTDNGQTGGICVPGDFSPDQVTCGCN